MIKTDNRYNLYINILKEELVPAMGCTEPICLAYAAAKAREALGKMHDKVDILASGNIIKNVKSVIVPNTNGMKGLKSSVAIGIVGGDPTKELEVIANVTPEQKQKTQEFLDSVPMTITHINCQEQLDVTIKLYKEEHFNPMGGCLPMLIQMPIIMGLFALLRNPMQYINGDGMLFAVHESFLWIMDLSQPDKWILPLLAGAATFLSFFIKQ